MAVRKSGKSAQPPWQNWEEESRCSRSRSPEDGRAGLECAERARSDGRTSVRHEKKLIFSYFRVEICSVPVRPVVRAGVECIDRVGSDGCTVSVTVLPEKKNMIF